MKTEQILEKNTDFKFGDRVRVMRRENPDDPSSRWKELKTGRITQIMGNFVRVWDNKARVDDYEAADPFLAEIFSVNSKCIKVVKW